MSHKKYITYLVFALLSVCVCIMALNYVVDPLLYYQRDNRVFPRYYTEEMRYLIPGLIRNSQNHNGVIIGSSMAANNLASEVGSLFNEEIIKLTINGSTLHEQTYVLSQYLDFHPKARLVLWGIDPVYIDKDPEEMTTQESYEYPLFLYGRSLFNIQYLLNYQVSVHSIQTIANYLFGIPFLKKTRDLDIIHTWTKFEKTGCDRVVEHYKNTTHRYSDLTDQQFNRANAITNLKTLTDLAESNRTIKFHLFLPPYSIIRYLFEIEHNGFERLLAARNLIAEQVKGIDNIDIVDLQTTEEIIVSLDYYKDMNHFNREINNLIYKRMLDGNFDSYEDVIKNTAKLRTFVESFDFAKAMKCGER